MEEIFKQVENEIKNIFHSESSGHDIYHLKRVFNNAMAIQKKEGGDRTIIGVSALLHDVHRILSNERGKYVPPKESFPEVKKILEKTKLTKEQKNKILHCIEFHEEYDFSEHGKTVKDLETLILQDADNLDAVGAIGIGRTFSFGGAHNVTMYIPEKPFDRKTYDESEKDPSTVHHFYSKLLKLKNNMNTKTGKSMASSRHKFMESFLEEFFDEWNGKK